MLTKRKRAGQEPLVRVGRDLEGVDEDDAAGHIGQAVHARDLVHTRVGRKRQRVDDRQVVGLGDGDEPEIHVLPERTVQRGAVELRDARSSPGGAEVRIGVRWDLERDDDGGLDVGDAAQGTDCSRAAGGEILVSNAS
jgi:hypothetical protein